MARIEKPTKFIYFLNETKINVWFMKLYNELLYDRCFGGIEVYIDNDEFIERFNLFLDYKSDKKLKTLKSKKEFIINMVNSGIEPLEEFKKFLVDIFGERYIK